MPRSNSQQLKQNEKTQQVRAYDFRFFTAPVEFVLRLFAEFFPNRSNWRVVTLHCHKQKRSCDCIAMERARQDHSQRLFDSADRHCGMHWSLAKGMYLSLREAIERPFAKSRKD